MSGAGTSPDVEFDELRSRLTRRELFADKSWRLAPAPLDIPAPLWDELPLIGEACLAFHRALENLYLKSRDGRTILRNGDMRADWVAELLDRGKPGDLTAHASSATLKGAYPPLLRPDLLWTDDGWVLSELDSIPGGLGLTLYLQKIYESKGGTFSGTYEEFLQEFWQVVTSGGGKAPGTVAFVLREEGMTYFPEFQYLAEELQARGYRAYARRAEELFPLGNVLHLNIEGNPERVDRIYRFFELFDLADMELREALLTGVNEGDLWITPAMRPFQEEKLGLALFRHNRLTEYWKQQLSKQQYRCLDRLIPKSWVMEDANLPPGAIWDGPSIGGRPIWDWRQLADGSQKERQLILKRSGFHPESWGARSVLLGSDVSREEWTRGIEEALAESGSNPFILQEYHKPRRVPFRVYDDEGAISTMEGRVRVCPYYFTDGESLRLGPVLGTVCPADKKIIHGMSVASMVPARRSLGD